MKNRYLRVTFSRNSIKDSGQSYCLRHLLIFFQKHKIHFGCSLNQYGKQGSYGHSRLKQSSLPFCSLRSAIVQAIKASKTQITRTYFIFRNPLLLFEENKISRLRLEMTNFTLYVPLAKNYRVFVK